MNLFLNRSNYTNNPENWPVVPFSLLRLKNAPGIFKTNYELGFEHWQIIGFGLSISDELIKAGIRRPTLIWVRKPTEDGKCWELEPKESESYYEHLSPYCHLLRDCLPEFKKSCKLRDSEVVKHVFEYLDGTQDIDEDIWEINVKKHTLFENDAEEEAIKIHIKEDAHGRRYFRYECPCMKLTETLYPIMCEDITIALVMVGQLVDNINIDDVKSAFNKNIKLCTQHDGNDNCSAISKLKSIKSDNIDRVIQTVFEEIENIQDIYLEQVRGERRRIMNKALNDLADIQRKFSLYKTNEELIKGSDLNLRDFEKVAAPARKCFRDSLDIIEHAFGVEQVRLFFDNNFEFECSKDSVFYQDWMNTDRKERHHEYLNISGKDGIGDLFDNFYGVPPKEGLTTESITPKDPDWSVFIFENAVITDEAGISDEVPPLVMGVKYIGGLDGKEHYLRANFNDYNADNELLWHKYVLPKFAIFARGVMLSIYLHKQTDTLLESRATTKHETGQVSLGLEGISDIFKLRRKNIEERIKKIDTDLLPKFTEFLKYCELYDGDVHGLFLRIRLTSKIYGNHPVPKPRKDDLYKAFLNKWKFAFFSNCRENNTEFYLELYEVRLTYIRKMYTDFDFLEHAIYNVASNGIKHALKYSKISLHVDKEEGYHIFRVINYGDYLNPNDDVIYKRGERNRHGLDAPHEAGKKSNERHHIGMGMGLYIAEKLVKVLKGTISYDCQTESQYNIPLADYYFDEMSEGRSITLKGWSEQDISSMREEYEKIKNEGKLNDILARKIGGKGMDEKRRDDLKKVPTDSFAKDMYEPTYRVEFKIRIPHYDRIGE